MVTGTLETDYDVITADDGLKGFLKAGLEPRPDLIITDVQMPKLDGIGMVKRLKRVLGEVEIPVVFLTSRDRPVDVIQGLRTGACYYLTKPFVPEDLLLKVKSALRATSS